ncbi:MAG TPA: lipopolysaccharide assembly protein LapA domain-containing protein [Methylibium sp.]|uniref:lipopolysaccharide assembly protein LapA domain-containing protein n=1 Tax=Methylibium sp. TaxID=2067992 RepID=UPI002DBF00BC|nr:lipopolysaccharide assembly protein LapA domain-containing protein [Methylibium sp.]HEU4457646.1 lipopolysaccharide assembly protein LapA domain-containing protein [Methylibium sp.]
MRVLVWLLRIVVFVALFAFALNNQHEVALKAFFGREWRSPMIFVVLAAFGAGCAAGVAGMLPSWWRARQPARSASSLPPGTAPPAAASTEPVALDHPPRDGL